MCGIAGYISFDGQNPCFDNPTRAMLAKMVYRGPDGHEITDIGKGSSMGSVRLAMNAIENKLVLLSNHDKSLVMAYNGEIYNSQSLRSMLQPSELEQCGENDGSVIVSLYQKFGSECFKYLDGMFGLAIWDRRKKKVILARDRMGIKPLYVYQAKRFIAFSSELKVFHSLGSLDLRPEAIDHYCALRFVPGPKTIYKDVEQVPPGTYCAIDQNERTVKTHTYWSLVFSSKHGSEADFKNVFDHSVITTAKSDSEIGVWLSGGLDSSTALAVMKAAQDRVKSFSIGYDSPGDEDESSYAAAVAQALQGTLFVRKISNNAIERLSRLSSFQLDQPLYTSVGISTLALAEATSGIVKGVSTGDGADELLMGYEYLRDVIDDFESKKDWQRRYKDRLSWAPLSVLKDLRKNDRFSSFSFLRDAPEAHPLDAVRRFELTYRLADYHLVRADRLGMYKSIEARVPFLRNDMIAWSSSQSYQSLWNNGARKAQLRAHFESMIADKVLSRTKKPFTSPAELWLRGPLKNHLANLMHEKRISQDLGFDATSVVALWESFQRNRASWRTVWGVYSLFNWHQATLEFRETAKTDPALRSRAVVPK